MKLNVHGEAFVIHNACGREERELKTPVSGLAFPACFERQVRDPEGGEYLALAVVDGLVRLLTPDCRQVEPSPARPCPGPAQLVKGVNKIGQEIDCAANEHEAERQLLTGLVCSFSFGGRLDDEWMGRGFVLAHHARPRRRGRLEHIGVDALPLKKTVGAFLVPHDADDAPEGRAESSPEG